MWPSSPIEFFYKMLWPVVMFGPVLGFAFIAAVLASLAVCAFAVWRPRARSIPAWGLSLANAATAGSWVHCLASALLPRCEATWGWIGIAMASTLAAASVAFVISMARRRQHLSGQGIRARVMVAVAGSSMLFAYLFTYAKYASKACGPLLLEWD